MFKSIGQYLMGTSRIIYLSMAALLAAGSIGCSKQDIGWGLYQQMAEQPKIKMHSPFQFFTDGRGNRPYEEGTVARGMLQENEHLYSGIKEGGTVATWKDFGASKEANVSPLAKEPMTAEQAKAPYYETFPMEVTEELINRGRERFNIYCSVCHGVTGAGNGMIVQRGYLPPPSFFVDNSRGLKYLTGAGVPLPEAPAGYYFQVISHGYGGMASYSAQISPKDRWAIIAYIRALQETFGKSVGPAVAQKEAK